MGRERKITSDDGADPATEEILARLATLEAQGRQILELVRALVTLLMPKEGGREGPALEDLLAQLIMQQREAIQIGRATREDLQGFSGMLPDAVAEAVATRGDAGGARPC